MNINIDVNISGDNGGTEAFRVILNQDDLTGIVKSEGLDAGNKALEHFVEKFVAQFKSKLAAVINR